MPRFLAFLTLIISMHKYYHQIPNLLTLANLFCGCCAVVFFLEPANMWLANSDFETKIITLPPQMWWGSLFIACSLVFDFLDGLVARALRVSSDLGKQLDSLADMVSFGLAPSMVFYALLRSALMQEMDTLHLSWFALAPAFILACAAGYRLACFNLDTRQKIHFIGMPTPAVALLVSSLPLCLWFDLAKIHIILLNPWILYALIGLLAYLMLSQRLYFFSIKPISGGIKHNFLAPSIAILFLITAYYFQWLAIPICWVFYLLISLLFQKRLRRQLG